MLVIIWSQLAIRPAGYQAAREDTTIY